MATGGWDPNDTDYVRSSSSLFMARPMTALNREATQIISEKARVLPDPVQKTFVRGMTSLCEQESETMLSFLADIRRSLHSTIDELRDEQEVLSSTASKLSLTRLNSARRGSDTVYVPPPKPSVAPPPPQPRIEVRRLNDSAAPRRGVRSARAQRIASARDRDRNSSRSSVETSMSSSSSTPLNTISEYISAVAGGSRPTTSGSGDRSSLGSSMDSVTFETELTRVNSSNRRTSPRTPTTLAFPGLQAPAVERARAEQPPKTTTAVFSAPTMSPHQQQPNTDDEYEEEKDEVMRQMSGISSQIDKERERQKAMLRDRQERKKVRHGENEQLASEMVREASLLGEQKRKEKERQENLIRERLEERKKRKNEITVVVEVEDRKQSDNGSSAVVQVSESNNQLDTTKSSTKNGVKNVKNDMGLHNEIIEIESQ